TVTAGNVTRIMDRNGNVVSLEYTTGDNVVWRITDPIGRTVTIDYGFRAQPQVLYDVIHYKGAGGLDRTIQVTHNNLGSLLRTTTWSGGGYVTSTMNNPSGSGTVPWRTMTYKELFP